MAKVTIRIDPELKECMKKVDENWSAYLREAIQQRIQLEERRNAAKTLLKMKKRRVPPGFIEEVIRKTRDTLD